jgi:IclR family acetate operon transcriptional repressor
MLAVPISVVSRLLATLHAQGYVVRDPDTKRYQLGLALLSLAQRHIAALHGEDSYLPRLHNLATSTGELAQLAAVVGRHMMWVAAVDGGRPLRVAVLTGREVVLHATAAGKIWLASLDPTEAVDVALRSGSLRACTSRTLTTVPALLDELTAVRCRGHARAEEELHLGVAAVAAPILVGPRVAAAVSVAFPCSRATPALWDEIARATVQASTDIATTWPENWGFIRAADDMTRLAGS